MRSSGDNHQVGELVRHRKEPYWYLANDGDGGTTVNDGSVKMIALGVAAWYPGKFSAKPRNRKSMKSGWMGCVASVTTK
jgi:hypothetical protein